MVGVRRATLCRGIRSRHALVYEIGGRVEALLYYTKSFELEG